MSAARQQVQAMQDTAQRRLRRTRVLLVTGGLLLALAVALVVALAVSGARDAGRGQRPVAAPAGVTASGGVLTGDPAAPSTVTIYLDYQCPACRAFEDSAGPWLAEQREAGALSVEYRPVAILDRFSSGTEYSTRSANAVACTVAGAGADAGADVAALTAALFSAQPPEGGTGLDDDRLTALARAAGAGEQVGACVTSGTYRPWVAQVSESATTALQDGGGGVTGTPTVLVDGTPVEASLAAVQAAVAAAPADQG